VIKKQVSVEELRLGMYVVELDRPWVGTDFAFQGFPVTCEEEIASLRSCCKTVFVDPERTHRGRGPGADDPVRGSTVYSELASVEQELPAAKAIYARYEHNAKRLFEHARTECELDAALVAGAVKSMTESIIRNPDAMLLLNRLYPKDSYELGRALDTSIVMMVFGRFLQLPLQRLEVLGLAGMLLDIGKSGAAGVPAIARPLYLREHDEGVKAHVMKSVELIRGTPGLPSGVDDVVALHHERQDGEGYPRALAGAAISIDGAIASLIDTYTELTSARPYAEQMSPSHALNTLHKLRGTLFHEALVEQFIQCIGIYPVGSAVELNSGEIGLVVAQNPARRLQPRVMVMLDARRNPLPAQRMLDLLKEPKLGSDDVYRIRRALPRDTLTIDARDFVI
jgi:HD-GYP domain-containing protein (c-di-GMP phosphodiesterase class II)